MRGLFLVTDPDWLATLKADGATEANFWRPGAQRVRAPVGTPVVFKVRGAESIGGFGVFAHYTQLPIDVAWDNFGRNNGVSTFSELESRIRRLRQGKSIAEIGCLVLTDIQILDPQNYLAAPRDWRPNIVSGAYYDLTVGEGARVWRELMARPTEVALSIFGGRAEPQLYQPRLGQGAFKSLILDAYGRRCAVSGESTLPVLEAAHIRPFADVGHHDIRNGILLRSDIHRLYDRGLVTITPELEFRVSREIDTRYSNGKIYYGLDGAAVRVPEDEAQRPRREALDWHARERFLG